MTAMEPTTEITQADVLSTAEKLDQFGQTLGPAEQAALSRVIARAARAGQADAEVQGYIIAILIGEQAPSLFGAGLLVSAVQSAFGDGSAPSQSALIGLL